MKDFLKLIFFGISKGPGVEIYNPETDERMALRIGFNIPFFLFSGLYGIPLFLKGMWKWGLLLLGLSVTGDCFRFQKMQQLANVTSFADMLGFNPDNPAETAVTVSVLILSVVLGIKGNEWRGREMLSKGWRFVDPQHAMARMAVRKWRLSKHYLKSKPAKRPETL